MNSKITTIAFAALFSAASSNATIISTYSVDFHGTVQPDTLAPSDVAGVIPTTNWDAAIGLTGGGSTFDDSGSGGALVYGWNAPMDGIIAGSTSTIGDEDMMEGYLVTRTDSPSITVQLTLPSLASLGWDEYDLYVYSNAGTSSLPGSTVDLYLGGGGIPVSYTHNDRVPGYGAGTSSYFDSQSFPTGNYVVYTGLTDPTQFLEISASTSALGQGYLNGIEIVGRQIPEPSSALLALLGIVPLLSRNRRKH